MSHECFLITSWQYLANTNTNAKKKEQEGKLQRIVTRKNYNRYEEGEYTKNSHYIVAEGDVVPLTRTCSHTHTRTHARTYAHTHACMHARAHARTRAWSGAVRPTDSHTDQQTEQHSGWLNWVAFARVSERDPWAYLPTQQGGRNSKLIHNSHACLLLIEPLMYRRFVDFKTKLHCALRIKQGRKLEINLRSASPDWMNLRIQLFKVAGPKIVTALLYFWEYYHQILHH